ncbi:unnamed protein product, partial [marine sediment metagenome]
KDCVKLPKKRGSGGGGGDLTSDIWLNIPSYIFKDRTLSVLEAIVKYLKEERMLSYHEIAVLLKRDDRTIWTVYNRVKKKHG